MFGDAGSLGHFLASGGIEARAEDRDILSPVVLQNRLHVDRID